MMPFFGVSLSHLFLYSVWWIQITENYHSFVFHSMCMNGSFFFFGVLNVNVLLGLEVAVLEAFMTILVGLGCELG